MAKRKRTKAESAKEQAQEVTAPAVETGDAVVEMLVDTVEPEVVAPVPVVETVAEPKKVINIVSPAEIPKVSLEDAVRQLIHDPRDHWLGSIKVRAGLMGVNVHQFHSLDKWKEVFIAWGGHGVLK